MKLEYLTELNDHELSQKIKRIKFNKTIDASIVGVTLGITIYSAVKNGLGFSTFFPAVLAYLIIRNSRNTKLLEKEMQKELESRFEE